MFDRQSKCAIALTLVFTVYSTRAEKFVVCENRCGEYSVHYPFGFSRGCEIELNCSNGHHIEIGGFQVQNITSGSIFVNLPSKCNRSMQSILPLFSENFAPTRNNSLLLQTCSSVFKDGCVIPSISLIGNKFKLDNCGNSRDNISCFSLQTMNAPDILSYADVTGLGCKFLFSAFANEQGNDLAVSLQLQVLELGWWLEGPCTCSEYAVCIVVNLGGGKSGYRCQCPENYIGDGHRNGTGCRRNGEVSRCSAATLASGACGKAAKVAVLVGGIIAVTFILLAAVRLSCYFAQRRDIFLRKQMKIKQLLNEATCNSNLVVYPYKDIERATNFFSEQRKLGSGSFGTVYVGKLHNEWVAVKKIKQSDNNSVIQVINEIKLLSSVSHPNLVRILGCWIDERKQILVLEFMPNGTLSQHLRRQRGTALPWKTRLTIATDTANAIAYLHFAVDPPIYHRDIKSSNILLDHNFRSKVADFGLSRLGKTDISHISTAPQGTPGYVDPEYERNFHLSDKSDVYSFGVVLAEIITAMKAVDFSRPPNEINLAALAVDRIGRGCVQEIMDPFLLQQADAWTDYSVHKVVELAFRCLDSCRDVRPTMMEVAEELEQIRCCECQNME